MKYAIYVLAGLSLLTMPLAEAQQAAASSLKVPFKYALGKSLFEQHCASCHGQSGQGTDKGPTFMSPVYKSSHHGDAAFYHAALNGARAHHWKFGDMPPVDGISRRKLDKIIPYIRWMQQQHGIH